MALPIAWMRSRVELRVGSAFSGIEGLGLGFERAGGTVLWHIEKDEACRRIIRRRFRSSERHQQGEPATGGDRTPSQYPPCGGTVGDPVIHSDITSVHGYDLAPVDVVVGGFPCQDLSVAGKRAGLAGERSGLWFQFHRLLAELAPRWVVIENVPGLLSSNGGRDMAVLLRGLAELGYGWAYRVLDAQYFGVAQRRRRVFIVGCLGDGSAAAQVLFESESCDGDSAPSRAPREGVAGTLSPGAHPGGVNGRDIESDLLISHPLRVGTSYDPQRADMMTYVPVGPDGQDVSHARGASPTATGHLDPTVETFLVAHTLKAEGHDASEDGTGRGVPLTIGTLQTREGHKNSNGGTGSQWLIPAAMAVRRLTPTECERLQGFPDGWTAGESDSARYRMLGNAVCVPVAEWIARRIVDVG